VSLPVRSSLPPRTRIWDVALGTNYRGSQHALSLTTSLAFGARMFLDSSDAECHPGLRRAQSITDRLLQLSFQWLVLNRIACGGGGVVFSYHIVCALEAAGEHGGHIPNYVFGVMVWEWGWVWDEWTDILRFSTQINKLFLSRCNISDDGRGERWYSAQLLSLGVVGSQLRMQ